MKEIQLTARLKIHDGRLEEFKIVAAGALETVREKDTGVRQYDWFLSADQSECVVRERYVDSQALLDHLAIVSEQLGALVGLSDLSLENCTATRHRSCFKHSTPSTQRCCPTFKGCSF